MNKYQKEIDRFVKKRDWDQFHNPKDLLLGIVEEVGELRNVIKWEQDSQKIHQALIKNKKTIKDDLGDMYWFMAILANGCEIDLEEAITEVINKNKKRFPIKHSKSKHTNILMGGTDHKYQK